MASSEERAHVQRLLREHRRVLRVLEIQQARQGDNTPSAVINEIEDRRAIIKDLEQHQPTERALEARQALRNQYDSDLEFLMADGAARNRRQTRIEERQNDMATQIFELKNTVIAVSADTHDIKHGLAHSEKARQRWAPVYRAAWLLLAVLIILHYFGVW